MTSPAEPHHQPAAPNLVAPRHIGPSVELGGTRLRVQLALGFFLVASIPGIAGGAPRMALSAAILSSALLAHELGHALPALAWGSRARIVLHVVGAHTEVEPSLSRSRALVAILMGPMTSLALGLLLGALRGTFPGQAWLTTAMWINVAWGAANLLPILPFDGGRVLLSFVGEQRRASALLVSGAFAGVIALEGLAVVHSALLTFVFGAAAVASMVNWAKARRDEVERALELPEKLTEARRLLESEEPDASRRLAIRVGENARCNETANAAWEVAAWAELELERPEDAYRTLQRVQPPSAVSNYCLAAVEAGRGQPARAITLLEAERARGSLRVEAVKLLIDLHARLGNLQAACRVASAELALLEPEDVRRIIKTALEWNAMASATQLAEKLFAATGIPDGAVGQERAS